VLFSGVEGVLYLFPPVRFSVKRKLLGEEAPVALVFHAVHPFPWTVQRVASILVCPQVDATSANQTSPSSRIAHVHHAMWVTFTETRCTNRQYTPVSERSVMHLLVTFIHRSAWKRSSANFVC
jgi:hypothetical protein